MLNFHELTDFEFSEVLADGLMSSNPDKSFSDERVKFLNEISKRILSDADSRAFPDLVTFGFFVRSSSIKQYISNHPPLLTHTRMGVGTALHISPANIPINFAFSWMYGFLSGCNNLVRLPTTVYPQIELFMKIFLDLVTQPEFNKYGETNHFFRSVRDDPRVDDLVQKVDAVLLWGGDRTISSFQRKLVSTDVRQLLFPSRQSSAVLSSEATIITLASPNRNKFLELAYNDTFLTDCNACSSPSKFFFIGSTKSNTEASHKFFEALDQYVLLQNRKPPIIQRMMDSFEVRGTSPHDFQLQYHGPSIRTIGPLKGSHFSGRPLRFGTFVVHTLPDLSNLASKLSLNEQTVLHWGLKVEEVEKLGSDLSKSHTSVTRLVPFGRALDIGFFWEGRDNPSGLVTFFENRGGEIFNK
jgi:hypothetical protein